LFHHIDPHAAPKGRPDVIKDSSHEMGPTADHRGGHEPNCESGLPVVVIAGMTWTVLIVVLVMAIAATKLARHSLTLLAMAASITVLVWILISRPSDHAVDREAHNGSHTNLTSRVIP